MGVLFDSRQAVVKPAGLKVLKQVSDALKDVPDKQIRIEGHTDNVPIGVKLRDKFAPNWELSTTRATSIVRYLIGEGGVNRDMISAAGYADTRPVATNASDDGKASNRRIELCSARRISPTSRRPERRLALESGGGGASAPSPPDFSDSSRRSYRPSVRYP